MQILNVTGTHKKGLGTDGLFLGDSIKVVTEGQDTLMILPLDEGALSRGTSLEE